MEKKFFMMALLLVGCSMTMGAQLKYDLNGDGEENVNDVTELVKVIMSQKEKSDTPDPIPLNSNPPANVVAVDLGLPSGTKWANMNVGAENAEDYGLYFTWGEITGYGGDTKDGHSFNKNNYKWYNGTNYTYNSETLNLEDDAAYMNWGCSWCMPTLKQIKELAGYTTKEATTLNGVKGYKFTSTINGNSIFLPNAGHRDYSDRTSATWNGYYWTSSITGSSGGKASYLYIGAGGGGSPVITHYILYRYYGLSVRPVLRNQPENSQTSKYDLNDDGVVNVADIVAIVNYMTNSNTDTDSNPNTGSGYFWLGTYLPKSSTFPTMNGKEVPGIVTTYTSLDDAMEKASRAYSAGEYAVVLYPSSWGAKDGLVFFDKANKKYYVTKKKDVSDFPDYTYYESTKKIGANTTITLSTETEAKAAGATIYVETTPTPTPTPAPNQSPSTGAS